MSQLNSINTLAWHCPPSKNDLDYRVIWGNNGTITIQRTNLIGIKFYMKAWNTLDGWIEIQSETILENPTSDPKTFTSVGKFYSFALGEGNGRYKGYPYKIEGKIEVIYGNVNSPSIDTVITIVEGCFRDGDPHYEDTLYPGCPPYPYSMCREL